MANAAFDQRGDQPDSAAFLARLQRRRDGGKRELTFVIGVRTGQTARSRTKRRRS